MTGGRFGHVRLSIRSGNLYFLFSATGALYLSLFVETSLDRLMCFFFFAWMIRDAPQQRLAPLISRMRQIEKIDKLVAETDT